MVGPSRFWLGPSELRTVVCPSRGLSRGARVAAAPWRPASNRRPAIYKSGF